MIQIKIDIDTKTFKNLLDKIGAKLMASTSVVVSSETENKAENGSVSQQGESAGGENSHPELVTVTKKKNDIPRNRSEKNVMSNEMKTWFLVHKKSLGVTYHELGKLIGIGGSTINKAMNGQSVLRSTLELINRYHTENK